MRKFLLTGIAIFILTISNFAFAAKIPTAPTENIYVADYAAMIDDATKNQILEIGGELDKKHKAQIVVVTIDTLGGSSIEEYANELFRNWGIGDKNLNNGVLLLIAKEDRKFRIEVGYGLEGAITDGYAGEVLDGMTNYFREGDYSAGILQAYGELTRKTYAEYGGEVPENVPEQKIQEDSLLDVFLGMIFCIVFVLIFYFFVRHVLALFVAVVFYLVSSIIYLVTFGKYGTLSFDKIYLAISESISFSGSHSGGGRSGGGSGRGGGGYGGGSSGGGGASGGW